MKYSSLVVTLSFFALRVFAQDGGNTMLALSSYYAVNSIAISGGAGLATADNYDLGFTGGIGFTRGVTSRIAVGVSLMGQGYHLYYLSQSPSGSEGVSVLEHDSYIFFAPKLDYAFGKKGHLHFYLSPGIGYNISADEVTQKWNTTNYPTVASNYDTTFNSSANVKKLVFRINFGLIEYIYAAPKWSITLTEDFGFLASELTTTGSPSDPQRTYYSPSGLSPAYVSLLLGIDRRYKSRYFVGAY